ncbi:hypothetical protein BMG523Draft_04201, partial [Frankia sp. BMG5.23]
MGMESTGVYWKPVFRLLEDQFECWLLNAAHVRNVPGRKTDVADAAWLADLVAHGLVRPSFVPPKPFRDLRDLTRARRTVVEEKTREVQRLEKLMQDAGVKLTSVASQPLGVSGRAILEKMIAGERNPEYLAELARGRLRGKIPALKVQPAGQPGQHLHIERVSCGRSGGHRRSWTRPACGQKRGKPDRSEPGRPRQTGLEDPCPDRRGRAAAGRGGLPGEP